MRHFGAVKAVDGVDMTVRKGEIFGFLGPNGAGKTTVIRILVTLLAPTAGSITVAGYDAVRQPVQVRLRIGAALQDAALDNKQTGRELLRLQGQLYGLSRRQINGRIADLSDLVDIGEAMDRLIGTYSGGMKRRLDLAAALIHNPEVLFLDEPTTGLDPVSRSRVWQEVRDINRQAGRHHLPDHPVPGGGGRPSPPNRHHQPWKAGSRGYAPGSETRPRLRPHHRQGRRRRRRSRGCAQGHRPGEQRGGAWQRADGKRRQRRGAYKRRRVGPGPSRGRHPGADPAYSHPGRRVSPCDRRAVAGRYRRPPATRRGPAFGLSLR